MFHTGTAAIVDLFPMNRKAERMFRVLAMPGRTCWVLYVPELGINAVVGAVDEIAPTARELIGYARGDATDSPQGKDLEVEVLPPLTTYPVPDKWLSPSADDRINPALARAYSWPDYPGQRAGNGRWVDIFSDAERERPIGRLWTDDNQGCGLLYVNYFDGTEYTVAALTIRHLYRTGVLATLAFELLRSMYTSGSVHAGSLGGIADLGIEQNCQFLNGV